METYIDVPPPIVQVPQVTFLACFLIDNNPPEPPGLVTRFSCPYSAGYVLLSMTKSVPQSQKPPLWSLHSLISQTYPSSFYIPNCWNDPYAEIFWPIELQADPISQGDVRSFQIQTISEEGIPGPKFVQSRVLMEIRPYP